MSLMYQDIVTIRQPYLIIMVVTLFDKKKTGVMPLYIRYDEMYIIYSRSMKI